MTRRTPAPRLALAVALAASLTLAGCTTAAGTVASTTTSSDATTTAATATGVWDATVVHTIDIDIAADQLATAVDTYLSTGEKVWVTATVTIDGTTFENVGLKLKGNSSLRSVTSDTAAADLPWIIRLDKFVDGQNLDGWTEFVVRGNSSETSLNEAVALDLLAQTGLASEQAVLAAVTIDGATALRLVVQNPDDAWAESELGSGPLYKAESGGSYDYVGDDPAAYATSFDQEAGDDDLTPLIDFLQFVNESDDATFAAELSSRLDVDAFATYLAFQDLVGNTDDIDGPGNNSYLYYDPESGRMTVVTWDLNLAFGQTPGGAGGPGGGAPAGGAARPGGQGGGQGGQAGGGPAGGGQAGAGGPSQGNILAERFRANDTFAALIEQARADLEATLIDSGAASDTIDRWVAVLGTQSLVSATAVEQEAAAIRDQLVG
jgi:spore coat protein CotH